MNPKWQLLNQVALGGTILALSEDPKDRLWAATQAGIFRKEGDGWHPLHFNLPFFQATAFRKVGKLFFAGGAAGGISYSLDGGETWNQAWIDQVENPVSCLILSPNYPKDHVLLAGTLGDGILRTTDSGRHWQLENFGLQGFHVFSLAAVAVSQTFRELTYTREFVFAGTDDGVYFSPNGGRAWKPAGRETAGEVILAVASSQEYHRDRTVYAGSESGKVFRSCDGGETWDPLDLGGIEPGAINCMVSLAGKQLLLGTSQAGILGSRDGGQRWEHVLDGVPPVLTLETLGDVVYAGLYQRGLFLSEDGALTWRAEEALTAHRFEWLALPKVERFLAVGPDEGIWQCHGLTEGWTRLETWMAEKAILGLTAVGDVILTAAQDGLYRSNDGGLSWVQVLSAEEMLPPEGMLDGLYTFANQGNTIWCGGENGRIWLSQDMGRNWQVKETGFGSVPVIAMGAWPEGSHSETGGDIKLVAGTLNETSNLLEIWAAESEGAWLRWHQEETSWYRMHIGILSERSDLLAILGLGTKVYEVEAGGRFNLVLDLEDEPITALAVSGDGRSAAIASLGRVFFRTGGESWEPIGFDGPGESVVGLQFSPKFESDSSLFALTSTGKLWQIQIDD